MLGYAERFTKPQKKARPIMVGDLCRDAKRRVWDEAAYWLTPMTNFVVTTRVMLSEGHGDVHESAEVRDHR
jgi:hypothetical protein